MYMIYILPWLPARSPLSSVRAASVLLFQNLSVYIRSAVRVNDDPRARVGVVNILPIIVQILTIRTVSVH